MRIETREQLDSYTRERAERYARTMIEECEFLLTSKVLDGTFRPIQDAVRYRQLRLRRELEELGHA